MHKFKWWKRKNSNEGYPADIAHADSDERSSLNDHLPKYYDGYDVDELFEKQNTGHLSKKEIEIIDEIVRGYYAERLKNKKDGKCTYGPLTINGAQIFPRGTVIEYPTVTEYRKKHGNRGRNDGQGDEE